MTGAAAQASASPTRWLRVAAGVGAGFAVALNIGKVPAALPALSAELELSLFWGGVVVSLFSALGAALGTFMGAAARAAGNLRAALAGLAFAAAGSLAGAHAHTLVVLLTSRVVEGLGFITVAVAVPPLVAASADDRARPVAMGIWAAFVPGGMALMLFASPSLIALGGWRAQWWSAAAAAIAAGVFLLSAFRNQAPDAAPDARRARHVLARGPLLLAGVFCAYSAQFICVTSFLPVLLHENHGVSVATGASMSAFVVAANILGNVGAGWLQRAGVPRKTVLIAAAACMGATTIAIYAASSPLWLSFTAALLFAAVGGLIPGTAFGAAPAYAATPSEIAVISGLMLQGASAGQLLGPLALTATVAAAGSWTHGAAFTLLAAALAIALAIRLPVPRPPPPAQGS